MIKFADCLIEIHTEELPPKAQIKLSESLRDGLAEKFGKENLAFDAIKAFATPRRIAVFVTKLADAQPDQVVERKGPALNAAFDQSGQPTKACEGFARSCGIKVSDLIKVKTEQGGWVVSRQAVKGKSVSVLLPVLLEQVISVLPIAKRMRWGGKEIEFARPVHSVILLYGKKVVPATILGCRTSNVAMGHRFMANKKIKITHAKDYETTLAKQGKIIADFAKRRELVQEQAQAVIADEIGKKGKVLLSDALLDEVTGLVEYPVALCGQFDKAFLQVPKEVLISAMQDHQRYFPVVNSNAELLPYFVTVSNIKSKKPQQVVHGNERVLRARLSDAKFFFDTDKHEKLLDRVEKLKDIVYQAKLGTLHDKAIRLAKLTAAIAAKLGLNKAHAERAGLLAKADLVTNMVGEFPELQGVMGEYYARHDGESEEVAIALREQYMPRFAGDTLPQTKLGCVLALADKLDLLTGSFGINQIPTGDKDPFGLRRAALGIVRILVEPDMQLDLREILEDAVRDYQSTVKFENQDTVNMVLNFIRERMRAWYQDQNITPDVFSAVVTLDVTSLQDFHKRVLAVQSFKKLQEAEALSAANKRVSNILSKYQETIQLHNVNPAFFEETVEKELARQLELIQGEVTRLCQAGQYNEVLLRLASLRKPVDEFFDKVMVMTEDRSRRENRLLLLTRLRNMFLQVADIALLQ